MVALSYECTRHATSYVDTTDIPGSLGVCSMFNGCYSCSRCEDHASLVALRVALEHRDEGWDPYLVLGEGRVKLGECRISFLLWSPYVEPLLDVWIIVVYA